MKIQILTIGKKNDPGIAEAVNDFTGRLGHYAPVEWKIIPSGDSVDKEGEAIISALESSDQVMLLDEKGKSVTSEGLAKVFENLLNASTKRVVFIIGGAFGVSEEVRKRASQIVTISAMTFPHQIVRLVLVEQIYRAFTILRGEKYHHS